jgi:uncharacterized protein
MGQLLPLSLIKVMQSHAYTVIILGNEAKKFAIYTEPQTGLHIQSYLAKSRPKRPLTYDLIDRILRGLNVKLLQVVIHDIEETLYFARLFVEQQVGDQKVILEIDARPSDCITLALLKQLPFFCTPQVLEKSVSFESS